jgi:hypothetical protein
MFQQVVFSGDVASTVLTASARKRIARPGASLDSEV